MKLFRRRLVWRLTPRFIRRRRLRQMNLKCEVIRLRLEVTHQRTCAAIARKELRRARQGLAFSDATPVSS